MATEEPEVIYGTFWQVTKDSVSIHHAGLIGFIAGGGFFWKNDDNQPCLMRLRNNILQESNITEIVAFVSAYIEQQPDYIGHGFQLSDLRNTFARGIVNYINLPKLRLLPIKEVRFHRDTKEKSYFYFKNCVVEESADKTVLLKYEELDGCVWSKQIRPYNFTLLSTDVKGQFETFCLRLSNNDEARYKSLQSIIGYMLNRYYVPSKTIIPCLVDETITSFVDEANGGSGKTVLCLALSYIRNMVDLDGKTFNANASFPYQRVGLDTEIIFIDDLARQVSLESFFSILSTGIEINQKGKPAFKIPREYTPKIIITSNFPIKSVAGFSTERRKAEFEAGTYYNEKRTIRDDFGCEFFTDWSEEEFNLMFNFFIRCTQAYLKYGVIKPPSINTELRKLITAVGADLKEFLDDRISEGKKSFDKQQLYDAFTRANPGQRDFYRSQKMFIHKVHKYLDLQNIKYHETPASTKKTIVISGEIPTDCKDTPTEEIPERGFKTIRDIPHEYTLVDTDEKRKALLSTLLSLQRFAFDTETAAGKTGNALDIHSLNAVGISFATKPGIAYYLPLPNDEVQATRLVKEFSPAFENPAIGKEGHNLKFDINVLRRYGVMVKGALFDTMAAHYLYEPESPHGLKDVSLEVLKFQQTHIEELIGKGSKQLSMWDVPLNKAADYACQDADITLQLSTKLKEMLKGRCSDNLIAIENGLIYVLADMEYTGIKVDSSILDAINSEAESLLKELSREIFQLAGKEFNINSPQQLGTVLFEEIGLSNVKTTKHGAPSTGKNDLVKLKQEHPIVPLILDYKQISSIQSSFLLGLPNKLSPVTGKVHAHFNSSKVVTGRLSSSEPNLQNIPKTQAGIGKSIRKAFVPADAAHKIIAADYSQIELRVMAHYSKDPVMVNAFKTGVDIHIATASKVFGIPVAEVKKDGKERKIAKTINFGLNYCMSAKGLADRISDATGKHVEIYEAEEYMERYFAEFSGVKRFHEEAYLLARDKGYTETLFGRRRYLPKINSLLRHEQEEARRMAINTPIQGTSADIMRIAMVALYKRLNIASLNSKILLSVHDELVLDSPVSELDVLLPMVKDVMESAASLIVPLEVEIGVGDNWLEAH